MKRYERLALIIDAYKRCIKDSNPWADKHKETIDTIMNSSPSGSGIDCGTKLDIDDSTSDKLVFHADFHHMDMNGYYDGWTQHEVKATPAFVGGIDLKINGRDRNQIKEYLHDVYHHWLTEEETPTAASEGE